MQRSTSLLFSIPLIFIKFWRYSPRMKPIDALGALGWLRWPKHVFLGVYNRHILKRPSAKTKTVGADGFELIRGKGKKPERGWIETNFYIEENFSVFQFAQSQFSTCKHQIMKEIVQRVRECRREMTVLSKVGDKVINIVFFFVFFLVP